MNKFKVFAAIAALALAFSLPASAAELRLAHPEATLQELVEAFDGTISRSGMSHRLRALEKLAEELAET